ncbi:MAG: FAD-dependent oxidoreductase [Rhodococcus fascians]
MTYVITQSCCNDAACVPVCPVNCIHPSPDEPGYATTEMLYIDPDGCIDCGACVDVCPVGAITPDYELADGLEPFEDLNAQYFRDPAKQGYEVVASGRKPRKWVADSVGSLKVAIVGSGPAACYAAEEILSQRGIDVAVDMFERLPAPWGLVRYGVAPDHQDTKSASEAFARTARRKGFRLFLNTEVGTDITHDELSRRYDAVLYAVGAVGDRSLSIAGENLPGSHSATEFVAWYNGHPDYADRSFDLSHERAVIIGNGNVALDVARVLLMDLAELERTDIADHALAALADSRIREVVIVGRRGPAQSAFTTPEFLGLVRRDDIDLVADKAETALDAATRTALASQPEALALYKARVIASNCVEDSAADRRIVFRFLRSPTEILGSDAVEGIRLVHNSMVTNDMGDIATVPTDSVESIACGLVVRSVGYKGYPIPGLPFDSDRGVVPHLHGRVIDADSAGVVAGVYVSGWIKRGPSGGIGTNKQCAHETVSSLLDDFSAGLLPRRVDDNDVAEAIPNHIDVQGWKVLDTHERSAGRSSKRPLVKVVDRQTMVDVARGGAQ